MLRHMNHECGVEKKIQCKVCFKKFRRKWNLEQHQKRIHREYYAKQIAARKQDQNSTDQQQDPKEEEEDEENIQDQD